MHHSKSRGRRLATAMLLLIGCSVGAQSWALGLGEIDVSSALNERFVGSIELLDGEGFNNAEIVVKMASREDFERVGVERFFFLTDLKFEVDVDAAGGPSVLVSSSQPVSEPYLNFIVEVVWAQGRLLKEFTVLLDPPTFSQASAPLVRQPETTAATEQPQSRPQTNTQPSRPATRVALQPRAEQPTRRAAPISQVDGDEIFTTRDDTLWKIANRTRTSEEITTSQQMLAIQRKNPSAFIRQNINLLKAGYRLKLPSHNEAAQITAAEAENQVAAQNSSWRNPGQQSIAAPTPLLDSDGEQLASQVSATDNQNEGVAATSEEQGQVKIVARAGEPGSGATGSGEVADANLTQVIEEKAVLSREVDELSEQLDREKEIAANQISVKDRQLDIKDQEIAQLQARLSEMQGELKKIVENQNQNPRATSEPVVVPWWQTPYFLFGVIGILILLLAVMLVVMRRQKEEQAEIEAYLESDNEIAIPEDTEEGYEEPVVEELQTEPTIGAVEVEQVPAEEDNLDADLEEFDLFEDADQENSQDAFSEDQDADGQDDVGATADVIGEAEIYIAYARYGQAANLLIGALNEDPSRYDVRLKLLEVYVETGEEAEFESHAQYILDNCEDEDILHACRDLENQMQESRVDLEASEVAEEIKEEVDDNEELVIDLDELDDDLTADLDGDEIDLDGEELSEDLLSGQHGDEASAAEEFELEFDGEELDLDAPADSELEDLAQATSSTDDDLSESLLDDRDGNQGSDALGGDLGLSFDPDRDVDEDIEGDLSDAASGADETSSDQVLDADGDDDFDLDAFDEDTDNQADGFEFAEGDDGDINETKLDLAEAYVDMGDADGAKDILNEVIAEGTSAQQDRARTMLSKLD